MLGTLFSTLNLTECRIKILFDVDLTHSDLSLVKFDAHLSVRKGKYLTVRNRLLSGKAGPVKILMF